MDGREIRRINNLLRARDFSTLSTRRSKIYKQRKDFTAEGAESAEGRVYLLLRALITEGSENAEKMHETNKN